MTSHLYGSDRGVPTVNKAAFLKAVRETRNDAGETLFNVIDEMRRATAAARPFKMSSAPRLFSLAGRLKEIAYHPVLDAVEGLRALHYSVSRLSEEEWIDHMVHAMRLIYLTRDSLKPRRSS